MPERSWMFGFKHPAHVDGPDSGNARANSLHQLTGLSLSKTLIPFNDVYSCSCFVIYEFNTSKAFIPILICESIEDFPGVAFANSRFVVLHPPFC